MLKTFARATEFNENSISKKKLRQILIFLILSLPTLPLGFLHFFGLLPENMIGTLGYIGFIAGAISFLGFLLTRFVNRFYFPDKYLDEWEIRIKHKSMAFAFMTMVWVVPLLLIIVLGMGNQVFELSTAALVMLSCAMLVILMYLQIFHALWQVRPINDDELV